MRKQFLVLCLLGICFYGCDNTNANQESKNECKGTKYYDAGYKMGKFSRNIQPDENYQTYGIEYYRLESGITKDDPKAGCYDEGFMDGKMGR